jgi:hypothetical protein
MEKLIKTVRDLISTRVELVLLKSKGSVSFDSTSQEDSLQRLLILALEDHYLSLLNNLLSISNDIHPLFRRNWEREIDTLIRSNPEVGVVSDPGPGNPGAKSAKEILNEYKLKGQGIGSSVPPTVTKIGDRTVHKTN